MEADIGKRKRASGEERKKETAERTRERECRENRWKGQTCCLVKNYGGIIVFYLSY